MYAKGQREIIVFGYAVAVAVLLCIIGYMSSSGCGRTGTDTAGDNGTNAAEQAQRAAEYNQQAGSEIESAAEAVGRAEQHADQTAALNRQAQARVSECQKLIDELRADNRRAKQIIDEVIADHQAGKAQDGAH